jgi:hypothetical protein
LGLAGAPVDEPAPVGSRLGFAWRLDERRSVDVTASVDVVSPLAGTSYLTVRTRFLRLRRCLA